MLHRTSTREHRVFSFLIAVLISPLLPKIYGVCAILLNIFADPRNISVRDQAGSELNLFRETLLPRYPSGIGITRGTVGILVSENRT